MIIVNWINDILILKKWHGLFLSVFMVVITLTCFVLAKYVAPITVGVEGGRFEQGEALLLFLGLLTLINAPFDWVSLGLTRALLRRGLELSRWWPFVLAIADAVAAVFIVSLLVVTTVIAVQTFDLLVVLGGGIPVLPLGALFDGIAADPAAPEYWWIYSLLLSTMIPSLINLAVGGASLMQGVPAVSSWLLMKMPAARPVPKFDRSLVAATLTIQIASGVVLGLAVQALLAWIVIFKTMPVIGLGLLDMARKVEAIELPTRIGRLFLDHF